jgi:hypothetical protein
MQSAKYNYHSDTPIYKDNYDKKLWLLEYLNDVEHMKKIIIEGDMYMQCISTNIHAIPFLEKYPEYINWNSLSINENAITILEKNIDKIDWFTFSHNKNAWQILKNHMSIDIFFKLEWEFIHPNNDKYMVEIIDNFYQQTHPKKSLFVKKNNKYSCWEYMTQYHPIQIQMRFH